MTIEQAVEATLQSLEIRLISPEDHEISPDQNVFTIERLGRKGEYVDLYHEPEMNVLLDIFLTEIEIIRLEI